VTAKRYHVSRHIDAPVFEGGRTYRLEEVAGGTEFSMTELLSGPLSGLITRTIPDMTDSFNQFADASRPPPKPPQVIPPAHREPAHEAQITGVSARSG
jgi:hypothetical protein